MLMRKRSQPGHSVGAGAGAAAAAAGARPSSTPTRLFNASTCVSSAFRRASTSWAPAMLQPNQRNNAASRSERIAQSCGDTPRVAAAGGGRCADAVLAEVAQAAGLVVDRDILGDEI